MKRGATTTSKTAPAATVSALTEQVRTIQQELQSTQQQRDALARQVAWFKRHVFGHKSEKRIDVPGEQHSLLTELASTTHAGDEAPTETITYQRRSAKQRDAGCVNDTGLRFDESVPVKDIALSAPELDGPNAHEYEVIAHKHTYRLAQRPASYVVLHYVRPVIKRRSTNTLMTVPAPSGVWEGSIADVSVIAGMLCDKFLYHLPLYRQHQRLAANGITLSRTTLTNWTHRAIALLTPIYEAQLRHILLSKTLAVDETPIKVGTAKKKGKLHTAWYWPMYGDHDELAFTYARSRATTHLDTVLNGFEGTLLSDGAPAYERFAATRPAVTHAQCWAHTRRAFHEAKDSEPHLVEEALARIGELYRVEQHIRENQLDGRAKRDYRLAHARAHVDTFFAWCDNQCENVERLPTDPFTRALHYALERRSALQVFLSDPDVAIDTNHLERGLRPIPMGRKSWLFCWTEVGAKYVGQIQSLLVTCRLHGVDPYAYLVDVLQRVAIHPDNRIDELTPRRWKTCFAHEPLLSDLQLVTNTT